ncbi:Gfo/Idh/MocA family protein [Pseudoponticoccus marisrubri]|uniref:Gfo/Idh/MocA family protein n=1 Tax=Pseudoponticoccus marisrubri TaxID=1685382 RepID=UPI001F0B3F64|nr:Gfo/Idh/MocA family oxidoreductase [Pseudoponticoccus marisrubri]
MNWALFGASTIASQYMISAIRANAGQVSWVVSGSRDRAERYARDNGIARGTSEMEEALNDPSVDAVYISSTNEKHKDQALAAIAAGKHVLCEKPLAMTLSDAARMVAAAREKGVTLMVNHHLRCAGSHRAIRKLIAEGAIGALRSVRVFHAVHLPEHLRGWRLDNPGAGGGVVLDMTVHDTDTVRFLLGEDPVSVTAETDATGMGAGVEDSAMSVWRMQSGTMVFSHVSFNHPFGTTGVEIHGSDGAIFAPGVISQDPKGEVWLTTSEGRREITFDRGNLYDSVLVEFGKAVRGEAHSGATGLDGVKSLAVALAVREAARTGQRQPLQFEEIA